MNQKDLICKDVKMYEFAMAIFVVYQSKTWQMCSVNAYELAITEKVKKNVMIDRKWKTRYY